MSSHIIAGEFQSDKYPTTPRGKVPLSVKDKAAQDLLWAYAKRHRMRDAQFSDDLEACLLAAGYVPAQPGTVELESLMDRITDLPAGALGYVSQTVAPYKLDLITLALYGLRNTLEILKEAEQAAKLRRENGDAQ